jgi:hypothetical protein
MKSTLDQVSITFRSVRCLEEFEMQPGTASTLEDSEDFNGTKGFTSACAALGSHRGNDGIRSSVAHNFED